MLLHCRIDAEAVELKKKLDKIVASEKLSGEIQDKASDESTKATIDVSSIIAITRLFIVLF